MTIDDAGAVQTGNLLIRSLCDEDRALLGPRLERVELSEKQVLVHAGSSIETAWFLEVGIASYASVSTSGLHTGIGIVGHEGFVGWQALLGSHTSNYEVTVTTGGGSALLIAVDELMLAGRQSPRLSQRLMRFVQSFVVQLGQTVVSNLNDPVERRLARWLLMNHDRLQGDEIELSHAEVGEMLGVRRASVTDALHLLEGKGLIRSKRRRIAIRDRVGLRVAAGENYGMAEAAYAALIGPFGKDS
jgi:CRP-like cAMP-binding protein